MRVFLSILIGFLTFTQGLKALELGDDAPNFRLFDQDWFSHSLAEHRGKFVLLFFYQKDFTSYGIRKVKAFERLYQDLKEKNVVIYGITHDFKNTHHHFHEKFHLTYDLLSDPDREVIRLYEANGWFGTKCLSILVGPDGRIFRKYENGKVSAHPILVL